MWINAIVVAALVALVSYSLFLIETDSPITSSTSATFEGKFSWLKSRNISYYVRRSRLLMSPNVTSDYDDNNGKLDILVLVISSNCNQGRRNSIRR